VGEEAFLDDTIAVLERTPRTVRALLTGMPESWLGEPDVAGGWTARDVVGHLISAELKAWIPRTEMVLEHGASRSFDAFDRFAHVERDVGASLDELIHRFESLRAENIARLRELVRSEADLERVGRHPDFGEVRLRQLLSAWTVHDLDHVQQIFSSLAASRSEAVGPWRANLGILLRRDAAPPASGR